MGAWGMGPFENDGALDCVADLSAAEPSSIADALSKAMREVTATKEYIENPEAEGAVAAAVLVAARLGASVAAPSARRLLESHPFEVTDELRSQALAVFDRLGDPRDNEWHELWDEGGQLDEVWDLLTAYREVLNGEGLSRTQIREQVRESVTGLDLNATYDVEAITETLIDRYGLTDTRDIETHEYWDIVSDHTDEDN